jgi:predicted PurR-regulated permease PerM
MSNELERSQFTAWVSLKKYKLDFDPMMAKAMELMKELQKLVREFSSLFFFFFFILFYSFFFFVSRQTKKKLWVLHIFTFVVQWSHSF